MHSAIYHGTIVHRRRAEREHVFVHRIAMVYLDLAEVEQLLGGRLVRPGGIVRFWRPDYLGDPTVSLADAVRALLTARLGVAPQGPIRLLTQLRSFGQCFNPVSVYYCFSAGSEQLAAIVLEVTNTPWGRRHAYVLPCDPQPGAPMAGRFDKALRVSPFMAMDQRYHWRATRPGETLTLRVTSHQAGENMLEAVLALSRRPMSRGEMRAMTARYPAATIRILALIYGHALVLRLKGVRIKASPQRRRG